MLLFTLLRAAATRCHFHATDDTPCQLIASIFAAALIAAFAVLFTHTCRCHDYFAATPAPFFRFRRRHELYIAAMDDSFYASSAMMR